MARIPISLGYVKKGIEPTGTLKVSKNGTYDVTGYASVEVNVQDVHTFGVQWNYSNSSPALTRIDDAAEFTDPVPAEDLVSTGSSPFDGIYPWSEMKRYNILSDGTVIPDTDPSFSQTNNDTVVWIPPFYYKAVKDTANTTWTWEISDKAQEGFELHPGSGKYIGRYHTTGSSSAVYTKSGSTPLIRTSQTDFRAYSANKGTGWRMLDLASWSAVQLLYLVEFANFYSQDKLGTGYDIRSIGEVGGTDSAVYHTIKASNAHNQYRWIEDPSSNVYDWVDGFLGDRTSVYTAANTSYTGTTSDLRSLGFALPSSGAIQGFGYSANAPWAFIPDTASGTNYTTYVTDRVDSSTSQYPVAVGGGYYNYADYGLFGFRANNAASSLGNYYGSRLLKDHD